MTESRKSLLMVSGPILAKSIAIEALW